MTDNSWTLIAIATLALLVMAGAATVEGSAGLISRQRLRQSALVAGRERSVQTLLDPRRSLVSALQFVQAIAIAVAAGAITLAITRQGRPGGVVVAVVVVSGIFLIFGQAVPRALARTKPAATAGFLLGLAQFLTALVRPFSALADATADLLTRFLGGDHPESVPAGGEDELLLVTREGEDDGVIEPEERRMIDNVLRLEETTARDIMVPRVDLVAVAEDASPQEILDTITEHGHSRVPVYHESIDQIVGILYAKDLLPFVIGSTRNLPIAKLMRPPYVVPESKRLDDLLGELRRNRVHIAVVADEYGGTAGVVTIEDILEEIVGEIHDEYDEETILLERIGDREIIVDGRVPIEEVAAALGLELNEQDDAYGTAAGFVHWHLDRLPQVGDTFETEELRAEVLEMDGHRLRRLRLTRLDEASAPRDDLEPDPEQEIAPPLSTS